MTGSMVAFGIMALVFGMQAAAYTINKDRWTALTWLALALIAALCSGLPK